LTKTAARSGVEDRAGQVVEGGIDTAAPREKEGFAAVVDVPKVVDNTGEALYLIKGGEVGGSAGGDGLFAAAKEESG